MPDETRFLPTGPTGSPGSSVDRAIADLATRQDGFVSRRQLAALGLTRHQIARRVRTGRLHPVLSGVVAVGHTATTPSGLVVAALLSAGDDAVASHRTAATAFGLLPRGPDVHVTVPRDRRRAGIVVHVATPAADERTMLGTLPVTTVARTLLDLGATERPADVERAIREAERRQLADRVGLAELLERHRGRRGTAVVRAVLADGRVGLGRTRSELEEAFLRFLDRHRLPRPMLNALVEGRERDCLWRHAGLVVELDSREYHDDDEAFDTDRRRDRALLVAGWKVVRVTWRHLLEEERELADDLRRLTATNGPDV